MKMMTDESNKRSQNKGPCVWILASGPHDDLKSALKWAPRPDKVIAANGGTALGGELGLTPDLIIGDLDSSPPAVIEQFEKAGVEVRRYDHDIKWETDTELAALAALDWHPGTILILGAIGGRLDHSLANILLLTHPQLASVDVRILDGEHEVFLAQPHQWNTVRGNQGDTVTLLPLGVDAVGVRTQGLHWPLQAEILPAGRGRGVSNRIDAPEARVWLDEGQLLVVVLHA
jgi:thiamine pyrophosphokinase